jgi:PleD family two-component response regulator
MVQRYQQSQASIDAVPHVRLAILVVGDEDQRRGALALYVTSGWDVRFATDVDTAEEAMSAVDLDAVIAEFDLEDPRTVTILTVARRLQPDARRFVRCSLRNRARPPIGDVVQAVVDRDSGMDGLVEALSGAFGPERALR